MKESEVVARYVEISARKTWATEITPSTVTDEQLNEIEHTIGLAFPPLYRALLKTYHYRRLWSPGIDFWPHPVDNWREKLNGLYKSWIPERILGIGLIPFGHEVQAEAGPTCFDTRRRTRDGDCPVVFWDHDWVGTDKEIQPLFSNSNAMFRCLMFLAEQTMNFLSHLEEYDPVEDLDIKRKLLTRFLALDPQGAGGEARENWTCWGVEPAD